jgi:hypothetical protein
MPGGRKSKKGRRGKTGNGLIKDANSHLMDIADD